ncbi:MAG: spore germination protein, partial [Firmicutes bacterium]|nr:spore germination protein [Bacillota bacterium]
ASVDRLIRYLCFFITTSTPAVYLSLITYHHQLIPTPLILSISAARKGVPFPAVVEVFTMGLLFEVLREGGIRLPRPIGQALSIVGAIVLGDAAVSAQLVSAPMIIVVATTGIAGFAVPQLYGTAILIRLIFALLASVLGLYGFFFGVMGLFIQLASMRSFGIPYLSSLDSNDFQDVKDTTIRAPWWSMFLRPRFIGKRNRTRMGRDTR